jgi:hypothetical protein
VGFDKTDTFYVVKSVLESFAQEVGDDKILGHDALPKISKENTSLEAAVEKAADYLVMVSHPFSAHPDKPFKFTVVRWALTKLNARFLIEHWPVTLCTSTALSL